MGLSRAAVAAEAAMAGGAIHPSICTHARMHARDSRLTGSAGGWCECEHAYGGGWVLVRAWVAGAGGANVSMHMEGVGCWRGGG